MSNEKTKISILTLKTQALGAQTISRVGYENLYRHQIKFLPTDASGVATTCATGTMTVAVRTPGASTYNTIGTMDLTDTSDYLMQFDGIIDYVQFTPTSFPAAKYYSLYLASTL